MKFINKKRVRKGWVKVNVGRSHSVEVMNWCRSNHSEPSKWFRAPYSDIFYFEKAHIATYVALRFV